MIAQRLAGTIQIPAKIRIRTSASRNRQDLIIATPKTSEVFKTSEVLEFSSGVLTDTTGTAGNRGNSPAGIPANIPAGRWDHRNN
jgi:hypothetical protein